MGFVLIQKHSVAPDRERWVFELKSRSSHHRDDFRNWVKLGSKVFRTITFKPQHCYKQTPVFIIWPCQLGEAWQWG